MTFLMTMITVVGFVGTVWMLCGNRVKGAVRRNVDEIKRKYTDPLDEFDEGCRNAKQAVERAEEKVKESLFERRKMELKIEDLKNVLSGEVENREQKEAVLKVYEDKLESFSTLCDSAVAKIREKKAILEKAGEKRQELALRQEILKLEDSLDSIINSVKENDLFSDSDISSLNKVEQEIEKKEFMRTVEI